MYVKLAFRNVKRSSKDYLIYLLTLCLSVSLFYGFLSITSPFYNRRLPVQMDLEYFSGKMKIIIPLIALLLAFLVSYVNRYMIKRRKKEFALEIIMGMEQRTVAYLFFIEMFLMGLIAVALGILSGTLMSQIVSAIIMTSFDESYHPYFSIFPDTVARTLLFFAALFAIIGFGNIRVIRKQKIIDMLHEEQQTESMATVKDMLFKSLMVALLLTMGILYLYVHAIFPVWGKLSGSAVKLAVLCLAGTLVFLLLTVSFFIVTAGFKKEGGLIAALLSLSGLVSGVSLLIMTGFFDELLQSGLITGSIYSFGPPLLAAGMLLLSIVSFFGCLSRLLVLVKKHSADFKYKHLFLLGQIISKMDTNSKTMSILTCVLIGAIILLGWLPIVTGQVDGYLRARSIYDVSVYTSGYGVKSLKELPAAGTNYAYVDAYLKKWGYTVADSARVATYFLKADDYKIRIVEDMPVLAVSLSDFNAILRLHGKAPIALPDGTFSVAWENTALPDEIRRFEKDHPNIRVGGKTFGRVSGTDYRMDIGTGLFINKKKAVYILPDAVCDTLTFAALEYNVNTTQPLTYDFAIKMEKDIIEWINRSGVIPEGLGKIQLKTLDYNEGISNSLMIRLGGTYTSLVLLVICLTILSLQQLIDAVEHKRRFQIVEKLGVDQKQINSCIRRQMSVWFGIPVLIAFCGAGAGIAYLAVKNYRDYIPYVSVNQMLINVLEVYGVFLLALVCYFITTFILFKRNIGK